MKDRVIKQEAILNKSEQLLAELKKALEVFESYQDSFMELSDYYGSEAYFEDLDEEATYPERYKGVARGVLSEDAVFNHLVDRRETCIGMLELVTKLLKEAY